MDFNELLVTSKFYKKWLMVGFSSIALVACGSNGGEKAELAAEAAAPAPPAAPPTLTLSVTPSTVTVANTSTVTSSNGTAPFTWSVVSGSATVNAGGVITPSASGTISVRGADSLGQYGVVQLTVSPNLSVTAAKRFLVYAETSTVTVAGGVPTISGNVQSGPLSLAGTTVTAGGTQGSGTIQWTDSLGNTSSVNFSVEPPVVASASATTVSANGSVNVSATGGYPNYSFSVASGGGSINATTGVFTAPSVPSTSLIRVVDQYNHIGSVTITTVGPPVISPAPLTLAVNNTATFTATGGASPYTYSIVSGGGTINSTTGFFTAPATAGTTVVRVTDSLGGTGESTVTVNPALAISPLGDTVNANGSKTFTATGGVSPYTFSVTSGGGTINASTGVFTAPVAPGTSTIQVTDSYGNTASTTLTILNQVSISPTTVTLAVNNTATFTATNGSSPYTFSVLSGDGTVNSTTGVYTAPATSGTATVRVTDQFGTTADATVTINPALAISPTNDQMLISATKTYSATGGVSPYTFSVTSGGGTINASTGVFTAPATPGTSTIQVTDSYGNTASTNLTILDNVTISPTTVTLAVNNSTTFTATNGSSPYTFSVLSGGGTINSTTGVYTAPATSGTATVRVTDQLGTTADATVTINPALAISPTDDHMLVSTTKTYSSTGGVSPYTYSVIMGLGSINSSSGLYTADSSAGAVTVQVQDALGNIASTGLTVVTPVIASPLSTSVVINGTTTISASGGQSPYTYSLSSGGGTINSTTGVYTAPGTPGAAVVLVTDSLGYTGTSNLTITGPLALTPLNSFVNVNQTKQFTGAGGTPPYTYAVISGGGTIDAAGLYTAPAAVGMATVRVTDAMSATVSTQIETLDPLTLTSPSSTLLINNSLTVVATGGKTPYFYSVVSGGGTIDPSTGAYTAPGTASTVVLRVTDSYSQTADRTINVYAPLQISPTSATILPSGTLDLDSTGGFGTITFSIVSGLGSINSSTGLYTAAASNYVAIVRATDSLGSTSDSTVTVNAALTINPVVFKMSTNSTWTFTAANGAGAPYTFSVVSGGGSINSSTGVYTAGSTPGTVTIRVTDSALSTADATVTVVEPSKIYVGPVNNCVQYSDNSLRCWGDGSAGQLGEGNINDRGDAANEMGNNMPWINLGTGRTVKDVSIGGTHICAILDNDSVKCWGSNASGQLGLGDILARGDGANEMGDSLPTVNLGTGRTAKKIRAGVSHTCAVLDNNTLKCWGLNGHGQLGIRNKVTMGDGANEMGDSLPVISLGTGRTALDVSVGFDSTCALLDNSTVKCWGRNMSGQLGRGNKQVHGDTAGDMGDALAAIALGTSRTATKLSSGNLHHCALLDNGDLKCWGEGGSGQLGTNNNASLGDGNNEMGDNLLAISLGTGLTPQTAFSAPTADFNCTIFTNGTLKCWGINGSGQLGKGNTTTLGDTTNEMGNNLLALDLGAGFSIDSMGVGTNHACAMSTDRTVKCWGGAANGVLGNASTTANLGDGANEMGASLPLVGI